MYVDTWKYQKLKTYMRWESLIFINDAIHKECKQGLIKTNKSRHYSDATQFIFKYVAGTGNTVLNTAIESTNFFKN